MSALTLESPRIAKALERIVEGKGRPPPRKRPAPVPAAPPSPAVRPAPATPSRIDARDLDAPDEVIAASGHLIERRAGRMTRNLVDPETGEVRQVEQRTREHTYTLWEPAAPGRKYAQTKPIAGIPWGAAHTLQWPGPAEPHRTPKLAPAFERAPSHVKAVEWELAQWSRATAAIREACPELAAIDGIGGQVLDIRGEVLLSGTVRVRYEHAMTRRPTHA